MIKIALPNGKYIELEKTALKFGRYTKQLLAASRAMSGIEDRPGKAWASQMVESARASIKSGRKALIAAGIIAPSATAAAYYYKKKKSKKKK